MFDRVGVNSLSAFRQLFWAQQLRPDGRPAGRAAAPTTPLSLGGPSSRSRWQVQQQGQETYVGELLDGQRHGGGILLTQVRWCIA